MQNERSGLIVILCSRSKFLNDTFSKIARMDNSQEFVKIYSMKGNKNAKSLPTPVPR